MRLIILLLLSLNSFSQRKMKGDRVPLNWEFNASIGVISSKIISDVGKDYPDFKKITVVSPITEVSAGLYIKNIYTAIEIQSGFNNNYTYFNSLLGYKIRSFRVIGGLSYYYFNRPRIYIKNYGFSPRLSLEKEFYILNTRFYVRSTGYLKSITFSTGMTFE